MGPPGYPVAPQPAPEASRRDPKLTAAGVLSILSGFFVGVLGVFLVWVTRDAADSGGDTFGLAGVLRAVGIFFLVIAAMYAVSGFGCAIGRQWGRIMAIVFNIFVGIVGLLGISDEGLASFPAAMFVWSAAIVVLAATGRPVRRS